MDNKSNSESKDFNSVNEKVIPLKDHVIKQNEFYYELKKDEPIAINKRFIQALKTEKVI